LGEQKGSIFTELLRVHTQFHRTNKTETNNNNNLVRERGELLGGGGGGAKVGDRRNLLKGKR